MSTLREALARTAETKKGPPCTMGLWLEGLGKTERAEAEQLLADSAWQHTQVSEALKALGVHVAAPTVSRHRRGVCQNCG